MGNSNNAKSKKGQESTWLVVNNKYDLTSDNIFRPEICDSLSSTNIVVSKFNVHNQHYIALALARTPSEEPF